MKSCCYICYRSVTDFQWLCYTNDLPIYILWLYVVTLFLRCHHVYITQYLPAEKKVFCLQYYRKIYSLKGMKQQKGQQEAAQRCLGNGGQGT